MRIILNLIILGLQGIVTFITLMAIYLMSVLLDYDGGIDVFVGTTLFQPIIGSLIIFLTIGICLVIGLPIRISERINVWWIKRIWIPILGMLLGLILITLSLTPLIAQTMDTPIENDIAPKQIPNIGLGTTGWFLTGFHCFTCFLLTGSRFGQSRIFQGIRGGRSENA